MSDCECVGALSVGKMFYEPLNRKLGFNHYFGLLFVVFSVSSGDFYSEQQTFYRENAESAFALFFSHL